MTSPSASTRTTPTGNMLENGYQSLITFAADDDIDLWEVECTPPGIDGGDPIDITTMHNVNVMTKDARDLYEWTDMQFTCLYDPNVYSQIVSIINTKTTITQTFPDEATIAAYGYLRSFTPDSLARGTAPTATVVIVITNVDPSDGSEEIPVITQGVGTP